MHTSLLELYDFDSGHGFRVGGPFKGILDMENPYDELLAADIRIMCPFVGWNTGVVPLRQAGISRFNQLVGKSVSDFKHVPKIGARRAEQLLVGRDLLLKACALFQRMHRSEVVLVQNQDHQIN